jgi:hypothetical protein
MKNYLSLFLLSLIFLTVALLLLSPDITVVLVSDAAGRILAEEPISTGDQVSVRYTHSVEKTPVNETYIVDAEGRLALTFATLESSGAGLPSDASYEVEQGINGTFIVHYSGRVYDSITYGTGNISRHVVIIGGKEYDIFDKLKENNKFNIVITRDSPINIFILHI